MPLLRGARVRLTRSLTARIGANTIGAMPFPAEHSARIADPSAFKSFRRLHPRDWPIGVDAVLGKRADGSEAIQSVRFDQAYDENAAKAWLKAGGYKAKRFELAAPGTTFKRMFKIEKVDEEHRVVSGWGYVCRDVAHKLVSKDRTTDDGQVVDHSGEVVDVFDLEKAMWGYVETSRKCDVMHDEEPVAVMVGHLTFTPELKKTIVPGGMDADFPEGTFLQYRVTDDDAWAAVKSGELKMFSLAGNCTREKL